MLFHETEANEVLFGGAAGGGKSAAILMEAAFRCIQIPNLQVYLFRDTYPDLTRNHIMPFRSKVPGELYDWSEGKHTATFRQTKAVLHFCSCQYEKDVFGYQGVPEIHLLLIDESTHFTEFVYLYLKGRVRCATEIPKAFRKRIPGILCGSNPGGIGHNYVKARWVDSAPPFKIHTGSDGMRLQYIPALVEDNPTLMTLDPGYVRRLEELPEPYRSAYRLGDWNVFFGQFFKWSFPHHVIDPIPVPNEAVIYTTFDWGYGAPYSSGYFWEDNDGRLYRFSEIYSGTSKDINKGTHETDDQIAEIIIEKEKELGISGRHIVRLGSHDCWNKKPNYMGGGQGPSTAEVFADYGLMLVRADPDREQKVRQFHMRLRVKRDVQGNVVDRPMFQVYRTCEHFIRTIPLLETDPKNVEFWKKDGNVEDHCVDPETEILTANGWRHFPDLNPGEHVVTMTKDRVIEMQVPTEHIARFYEGPMYTHEGRVSFCVTPRHRFPVSTVHSYQNKHDNSWQHEFIDRMAQSGKWRLSRDGIWNPPRPCPYVNFPSATTNPNANQVNRIELHSLLRYLGFWIAEGCIGKASKTHRAVHVDQNGRASVVAGFISSLGYRYNTYLSPTTGCTRWTIQSQQLYEFIVRNFGPTPYSYTKYIPRWILNLPKDYLESLWEGLMFGDGTHQKGHQVYGTTSRQLADDVQELIFKMGKRSTIRTYPIDSRLRKHPPRYNPYCYYRQQVFEVDTAWVRHDEIEQKAYSGIVYCVRVPNETIYLRRKGTTYWSSNCIDDTCQVFMHRQMRASSGHSVVSAGNSIEQAFAKARH